MCDHMCITHSYVFNIRMRRLIRMRRSWLIYTCITLIRVWHMCDHTGITHSNACNIFVKWLIHMCEMTYSYVYNICMRWLICMCGSWLIHTCIALIHVWHMWGHTGITISHVYNICVRRLIHICEMTHSCITYKWYESFVCVVRDLFTRV